MKKLWFSLLMVFAGISLFAQNVPYTPYLKKSRDQKYEYTEIFNDPAKSRWYKLKNGLTVIIAENHLEPSVMSLFVTKAGSKHDPATNTGLAHYLEHMLFKGTDKFGTKDYPKEQVELKKIEALYEQYNKTSDAVLRKSIYRQIDSISGVAAKYAIPNEYDKLMAGIGSKMTNAFTSFENTTYMENFPSNNLEQFLKIQAERFRNPVMRLFHTELEAVYEEKNISLDNGDNKIFESMFASLFKNHPYGTQTTIGTIEHLKNPSLVEIRNYFNKYYVPNNMALILAGDVNPDETIALVDKYLGQWNGKQVTQPVFPIEKSRSTKEEITVLSPDEEKVAIGFLMPAINDDEALTAELVSSILYNGKSGLLDKNLVLNQQILEGYAFTYLLKDNGLIWFQAKPKEGQTLEEVRDLLLGEIKKLKSGQFDPTIIMGTVNNIKIDRIRQMEKATSTAFILHECFVMEKPWAAYLNDLDAMSKITKEDVVKFAEKWFKDNYTVVYKKTGVDPNTSKVDKPQITPVEVNRDATSPFQDEILAMKGKEIKPVFLDFNKDITHAEVAKNLPLLYTPNTINQLFSVFYRYDIGTKHSDKLELALEYLNYIGTTTKSNEQINSELYNLGLNWHAYATEEFVQVGLSGLEENFDKGIAIIEDLLNNPKADQMALKKMVANKIKSRKDNLINKDEMFYKGLNTYLKYGAHNPYNTGLSNDQLLSIQSSELIDLLKSLKTYEHRVLYCGARPVDKLTTTLKQKHKYVDKFVKPTVKNNFKEAVTDQNRVYFVDYDMVQAQIMYSRTGDAYTPALEVPAKVFNEYYGGGMGSVVFQDIRESKALAYSSYSTFSVPSKKDKPFTALFFVGTQADKMHDAMAAVSNLLENMPESEQLLNVSKRVLVSSIAAQRINKENILFAYEAAKNKGLDYDIRKDYYEKAAGLSLNDIKDFHAKEFKSKTWNIGIMGSKNRINVEELKKYGTVQTLTLKDLYGYDEKDFERP